MAYLVSKLEEEPILQTKVINRIKSGRKVVFKFERKEDKLKFLHHVAELWAGYGFATGSTIGGIAGGVIGGPVGAAVGSVVGGLIGAIIGYSLGIWLANFLWENIENKEALQFKEAFHWFGVAPNRVIASAS